MKYNEKDDVTNLPKELRNEALRITPSYQLNIFEKFFLSVYHPKRSSFKSIDHETMDAFNASPNSNFLFEKMFKRTHQASLFRKWFVMERRREKRSITRHIRVGMENEQQ